MNNLPKVIIPGFQKCATTALVKLLHDHPRMMRANCTIEKTGQTINGSAIDEVNYFSSEWNKQDIDWYKSFFQFRPEHDKHTRKNTIWYEKSPTYCDYDVNNVAARMHQTVPDIKLIFVVRDPCDRAFSAFNHYNQVFPNSKDWGPWKRELSFVENLQDNEVFYMDYADVLKSYNNYYDRSNMLIIVQEQLLQTPHEIYSKIFKFLNIDPDFKIENKLLHARPKTVPRGKLTPEVNERFGKIKQSLYDWLGYEIEEWEQ